MHGNQGIVIRTVGDGYSKALGLLMEPSDVLGNIARIDAKKIILRCSHINKQIVHHSAGGVTHGRIDNSSREQLGNIVRYKVIEEEERLGTLHIDLAHVTDIE